MSSTVGGGGSGGSGGQIRYSIIIDDAQVNQKLNNFQSTLGRIDTATRSSASGLGGLNSTLQTFDSSLQSSTRDLDTISNSFRSMDSSVQTAGRNVATMGNEFSATLNPIKNTGDALNQINTSTETLGSRMKSAGGFLRDNALAVGAVSSSVIGLVQGYTSLQKAQNTLDRAQNIEIGMKNKITNLTEKHAEAVAKYGANSTEALKIQRDLDLLNQKHSTQLEKLIIMQEQLNQRTADFASSSIGQVVFAGSGLLTMVSGIRDGFNGLKSTITALTAAVAGTSGLTASLIALTGPLAAVTAAGIIAFQAFQVNKDIVSELTDKMNIQVQNMPVWEAAWIRIRQTFGLASKEEIARLDALELLDKKTQELQSNIQKDVPLSSRIFGLTPEDKQKILENIKNMGTDVQKAVNDIFNDAGTQTSKLGEVISNVTEDVLKPGTKAFYDNVVATIVARNKAIEVGDSWDNLWSSGVNLGKVLTDNTGKQFTYNDVLGKWVEIAAKIPDAIKGVEGSFNDVISATGGTSFMESWRDLDLAGTLKEQLDKAQKTAETGLDKIIEAFHNTKKGKLDFELNMDNAEKKMDKFLGNVGKKLDDGGSEGAKKYVESYVSEAEKKMEGAARIQFQPIFDFVEKHKGEDAGSWMDAFLQLIGNSNDDTKKKFTQLLIKDKEWKEFGKDSGESWTDGFSGALDDAKREANKAARDIEKALGLGKGDLSFKIGSKAMGGLVTSAATGTMFTTTGPTLTLAGDNPGGKETVAYIPHNNPEPTLAKIDSMFGRRSINGNDQPIIINLQNVTRVDGTDLINSREWKKQVRMEVGKNRDRFL